MQVPAWDEDVACAATKLIFLILNLCIARSPQQSELCQRMTDLQPMPSGIASPDCGLHAAFDPDRVVSRHRGLPQL
jgi:hypothetical protein